MRYRVSRYYGEDFIFEDSLTAMAFAETMFKHQILDDKSNKNTEVSIIIEDEPQEAAEKKED